MPQKQYISHYDNLKNKWTDKRNKLHQSLWEKHSETLNWFTKHVNNAFVGSVAGFIMVTMPVPTPVQPPPTQTQQEISIDKRVFLINDLSHVLPQTVEPLSVSQEQTISTMLSRYYGIPVSASLQGIRLDRTYGYIGQEQHLARFPGDTMENHLDTQEDREQYQQYGMAPGLGAWRYFAPSQSEMTQEESDREKYYIAVQTFLAPGYQDHVHEYSEFFKFRKMLVVNPENGRALVADIGDAGPSPWTGKHLGGSPEVMHYLQRVDGVQKGPVLYFFIDDPNDTIPLGPISIK